MSEQKFSRGVEKVVLLAALDEEFRARLLSDRAAALDSCEVELTENERAILSAIPPAQLESVIKNAEVPKSAKKAFLRGVAATAVLAAVLAGTSCGNTSNSRDGFDSTRGTRPVRQEEIKSIEHTTVTMGLRADRDYVERRKPEKSEKDAPSGK